MNSTIQKCRLCLKLGDFCSIYEQDDSIKLSEMVMAFTNIQIYEGDGLSDRVCTSCIENLSTAFLFKQQCERIDSMLRKAPDTNINQPALEDYNEFFHKEFHQHTEYDEGCVEGDNNQNFVKDTATEPPKEIRMGWVHETSDETDSDMDSVKCVCCNESYSTMGAHTCRVQCTIEHNNLQRSSSNETLVASDLSPIAHASRPVPPIPQRPSTVTVSCVLCDEKYDQYDDYVIHINKCTTNVKLHHFVCPVCHEMHTNKLAYLEHLKMVHFRAASPAGIDCVDFTPTLEKSRRPNWGMSELKFECKHGDNCALAPLTIILRSLQSTPKRVSFKKFIENGKAKTAVYLPFQKYIKNYKQKKKANGYSPIKGQMQITTKVRASLPAEVVSGVVAENTKMEMMATHFISVLPNDTFTGMMVCALATGKWLLTVSFVYDSFRCKKFLQILEIDSTSVEVAKGAVYWHLELQALNARFPFEGKQIVLIMKKKYRQYYQMIFKTLKAKPLKFFARHNVPVLPYQYILVYLLKRGKVQDEHKYLLQDYKMYPTENSYLLNNTC
ncbi:putative DNA topoisomerase 2-binding protein 1 [Operophtera brumata]|uniref:Putative DNA topoisomerase 2-binding protein 1 n=1 Tax=Operophtera brumata TaxID=104452 RepID=A0A0L7LKP7_OPEBR|nr:putative DNA topoisomerase 2-binding protein 1 [Operophtera brumata]